MVQDISHNQKIIRKLLLILHHLTQFHNKIPHCSKKKTAAQKNFPLLYSHSLFTRKLQQQRSSGQRVSRKRINRPWKESYKY